MLYFLQKTLELNTDADKTYVAGNLWVKKEDGIFENVDEQKFFNISENNLEEISEEQFKLLLHVPIKQRNELFIDKQLNEITQFKTDSYVLIKSLNETTKNITGTVKCRFERCKTSTKWVGYTFGIQLDDEFAGKGTSNGFFGNFQHFKCNDNCAAFVNVHKIKLLFLKKNDRVNWINNDGYDTFGTVKWLGLLPDYNQLLYAGLEFDKPVGNGTGKYKNEVLFSTKKNHASLIPIIGLIKVDSNESLKNDDEDTEVLNIQTENNSTLLDPNLSLEQNENIDNLVIKKYLKSIFTYNGALIKKLESLSVEDTMLGQINLLLKNMDINYLNNDIDSWVSVVKLCFPAFNPMNFHNFITTIFSDVLKLSLKLYKYTSIDITNNCKELYPSSVDQVSIKLSNFVTKNNRIKNLMENYFLHNFIFLSSQNDLPILVVEIEEETTCIPDLTLNLSEFIMYCSCCNNIQNTNEDFLYCKDCENADTNNQINYHKFIYCKNCCSNFHESSQLQHNQIMLHYFFDKILMHSRISDEVQTKQLSKSWRLYSIISGVNNELKFLSLSPEGRWILDDNDVGSLLINNYFGSYETAPSLIKEILMNVKYCFYAPVD